MTSDRMLPRRMLPRLFAGLWLSLLCLLAMSSQAAERAEIWQGTIGKLPVVVRIDPSAEGFNDQYFYRRHRRGIDLQLARGDDGSLTIKERPPNWNAEAAEWTLSAPSKDGRLRGEWRQGDKRLPIALKRLDPSALPASDDPGLAQMRRDDPYNYLRFVGLALKAGKNQTVGAYRLRWWRDTESGVELFRIVSGYPEAQRVGVNRALSRRHWQEIAASLDCRSAQMSDYSTITTLRYIGRDALSVSLRADYFCGGAHPDFNDGPLNLDPRTGRELALEDVLWLGKGTPPDRETDDDAWMKYRTDVFAPWVLERMTELYAKEVAGEIETTDEENPGCSYDSAEYWNFASWHIRPEGIYVGATFPRVGRMCDDPPWSVLPWSEVRKRVGAVKIKP
jgi:hypothetical protein